MQFLTTNAVLLILAGAFSAPAVFSQEATATSVQPVESYRADFQIREESGKARRFSMLIENGKTNLLRIGNRTPIATALSPNGAPTQFSFVESGLSMEARVRNQNGKLSLWVNLDVSSVLPADRAASSTGGNPTSNVRVTVQTLVTPKKPTVIGSIDDPATSRRLDVEVTLTLLE